MKYLTLLGVCVAVLSINTSNAVAADSCTDWLKQSDGTYWRTCVDDNGRQYCQQLSADGKTISTVKCSS